MDCNRVPLKRRRTIQHSGRSMRRIFGLSRALLTTRGATGCREMDLEETAHRLQTLLDAVTQARRNLPSDDDGDLASAQTVYVQQQLEVLAEGTEISQADVQTGLSAVQKKRERIMAALAILSPELHTHFTGQARACQVESAQKSSQLQFNVFQTDKSGAERKSHSCRLPGAQSGQDRFETELLEACGEMMWRNRGDGNREKQSRWYQLSRGRENTGHAATSRWALDENLPQEVDLQDALFKTVRDMAKTIQQQN